MRLYQITSLISATASNEMFYKYPQDGHSDYIHRADMTDEEIQIVFPGAPKTTKRITGNVPLYTYDFIKKFNADQDKFTVHWLDIIDNEIHKLVRNTPPEDINKLYENMMEMVQRSECYILPYVYDRKYFVWNKEIRSFQAIFPLADLAWTNHLRTVYKSNDD